jgi:uncharacterized membrane protein
VGELPGTGGLGTGGPREVSLEVHIGRLLRVMVAAAVAVVGAGSVAFLVKHGSEPFSYATFSPGTMDLRSPVRILATAFTLDPAAVVQLGVLILLATPIARVVLSAVTYVRTRDVTYACLTLTVLAVLLFSLFGRG